MTSNSLITNHSNEKNIKVIAKEIADAVNIAIRYDTIDKFARKCGIVDINSILELTSGKLTNLPDRNLLRKIANNSSGRVTTTYLYSLCGYSETDYEEDKSWISFSPKRGCIYMADLGTTEFGIQGDLRPVYIVQNDIGNKNAPSVVVIPVTKHDKRNLPVHAHLTIFDGLRENSVVICEQITTISKRQFFYDGYPKLITKLSEEKQEEIKTALEKELGFIPLMFDENKAFEMIRYIKTLKAIKKYHPSKNLVDMINDTIKKLKNECKKYNKDINEVLENFKQYESQNALATAT